MEGKQKRYVGSGKQVKDFEMVNISLCISDILSGDIREFNGKKYVSLTLGKKREIDQFGKSHALWINEFTPDKSKSKDSTPSSKETVDPSSLPF